MYVYTIYTRAGLSVVRSIECCRCCSSNACWVVNSTSSPAQVTPEAKSPSTFARHSLVNASMQTWREGVL